MKPDLNKYIKGNMSEEEFEHISEQLIQAKFDRDKKKIWQQKLKEQYGVERTTTPKKRLFYRLYIAASFLLLLAVSIYFMNSNSKPDHLLALNEHIEDLTIISGSPFRGDNDIDAKIEKASQYYRDKQFDKSILLWQQIIASEKEIASIKKIASEKGIDIQILNSGIDINFTFYINKAYYDLAVCYLQKLSPEPKQAIKFLKISGLNGPKEEIAWMLSLAYLKDGQKEKGIEGLSEIVDKKMYKSNEAKKLLDLLLD